MLITTAAEMRTIDRVTSERYGVPSLTLMENAGTAVAKFAVERWPDARRVLVICGKGNNGGDGFVAARKLREMGREVRVVLLASPSELRGDAAAMFGQMVTSAEETDPHLRKAADVGHPHASGISVERISVEEVRSSDELRRVFDEAVRQSDLIIDAILGTGVRPPVTGLYAEAISLINASSLPVLAVDIPSGADSDAYQPDTANLRARAVAIVTFTAPRPAHVFGQLTTGPIVVAPIGSPDEALVSELKLQVITAHDVAPLFAPRAEDANKGRFGHVLTVGGSLGKSGAAAMAGMAALLVGAGLSTVATPKSVLPMVAGFAPELMTEALPETNDGTIRGIGNMGLLEGKSVIAAGPGISRNPETVEFVREFVPGRKQPVVLDADGLNAFEGAAELLNGAERPLVLTPHPGEMSRLTGLSIAEIQRDRLGVARKFAAEHRLVLVLKGHRTVVALPDGMLWINPTGNPGMAKGGSGDVLTGMVAGMMSQFPHDVARAVCAAVYLHGLAGDVARERVGELSMTAANLLHAIPEAIRSAQDPRFWFLVSGF
jgi:ADP-dependent NAD(P)H-hydrate dehydratase / NAD(P)H-hydrate epimerase